jgi:hypothetical protein
MPTPKRCNAPGTLSDQRRSAAQEALKGNPPDTPDQTAQREPEA